MTPRITLSRIIAVNWYGYRQFIDVSGLSLITGANGSGKSALLDLIQFVMLGEHLSRFNKAAAGAGSGRTLRGYCLCDTNTLGRDGQERFLRTSGVTLAALEFEFPRQEGEDEPRRQTWGARIEFDSPTAKGRTLWFSMPGRLERSDFLRENLLQGEEFLPEDEFRVHLKRDLGGESWEHQRTYLEEMRQRTALHFDREQMNKTLPKAMAFQPESNFEAFIRDYLLEAGMPDVRAVKASVDAHRRAKERLDKMRDQHTRLTRINELHAVAATHRREAALWTHLKDALLHEEAVERLQADQKKLRERVEENETSLRARVEAIRERDRLRNQLDEVRFVVGQDAQLARLSEEKEKLERLKRELHTLREARKTASQFIHDHSQNWRDWLRLGERLGLESLEESYALVESLSQNAESQAFETIHRLSREGARLLDEVKVQLTRIEDVIRRQERREAELVRDLENYQKDRTNASPLLEALHEAGLKAEALGRLIEVKPAAEPWWPLLETLLERERTTVLPENFAAAWEVAQRVAHSEEALLNPAELKKRTAKPKGGSIRDFFEVKHKAASAYLDELLGQIMPVEHPSFMDEHERALSRDGWLKDPPRRVLLQPAKELTLGEEGLRRLREIRQTELHAVREELSIARRERNDWRTWVDRAGQGRLVHPEVPNVAHALHRLPEAETELGTIEETIKLLATPEREKAADELQKLISDERGASERAVRLDERLRAVDQEIRELRDKVAVDESDESERKLERQLSRSRLSGVLESEVSERIVKARREYSSWQKRFDAAIAVASSEQGRAADMIRERDAARRDFLLVHREMAEVFDPGEEENDSYEKRCRELGEQELERFQAEAERAREEWEDRLQHQVLDVLRDKINEAERTKRELNKAMHHDIGGMSYQIVSHRDRAHSAIWTLVEKGLPTGEDMGLFNASQREDIERAKEELIAAIESVDNPDDKKGQKALDYRFYHRWDIEARPTGKGDEAAISLNKSAKKQSGGENQAPFFVATLAAFHRVYDVGGRGGPPTLGLVVMDEAFSKLSGDRIDDCLALARNFGLQLVMAFPEDRLPTMIEHAETVVQCRVERSYHAKSGAVDNIENWVVRVSRDRLRELLA